MSTATEAPRIPAQSTTTATPRRSAAQRVRRVVLPALVLLAGLTLWVAVTYLVLDERRRFLLPPPWAVAHTGLVDPASRSAIVAALTQTATVALTGLGVAVLVGVTVAVLMSQARWLEESIYPYAVIVQTLPIVAIVPLVGLWLGFNFSSRVIVCVVMSLFPIITNTLFGLKSADPGLHDLTDAIARDLLACLVQGRREFVPRDEADHPRVELDEDHCRRGVPLRHLLDGFDRHVHESALLQRLGRLAGKQRNLLKAHRLRPRPAHVPVGCQELRADVQQGR